MSEGEWPHSDAEHPRREAALARLAGRQLGVVSRAQLDALGFTRGQVARRVAQGRLHRLFHRVYAVGHRRITDRAYLLAALLSLGPSAFLSHRTAAAVWGLRAVNLRALELTVPGSGGRRRPHLTVHRCEDEPDGDDVRLHVDLRVSSVPRMLIELAPRETPGELERLVTLAVRKRLLRPDARDGRATIEAALVRHNGRSGMKRLRAVLATYLRIEDHKSQLERAFDRMLAEHPDIPAPQHNVHLDVWELDRFWPQHKLAVELDGRPYHIAVGDLERDRRKDIALQRRGLTPLRFTDFRVEHEPRGVLGDLRHFLNLSPPDGPAL
jgi:very-short-patch-repair endonuclease